MRPRINNKPGTKRVGSSSLFGTKRYSSFEEKYAFLKKAHERFLEEAEELMDIPAQKDIRVGSVIQITILGITKKVTVKGETLEAYKSLKYQIIKF